MLQKPLRKRKRGEVKASTKRNVTRRRAKVIEATSRTAFRQNNWVMIPPYNLPATNPRVNIELGNSKDYLLFNLDEDISQQNDLSKSNPEKLNEMIARYDEILGNNKKKAEKLELE